MASTTSAPTSHACIVLSSTNKLRALSFPDNIIPIIGNVLVKSWSKGVEDNGNSPETGHEWRMSGEPWLGQGSSAVPSRSLIANLLSELAANGWHLFMSTNLSKKTVSKDTLIFRPGPSVRLTIFSISFNESNIIRLIDSPGAQVAEAFKTAVQPMHGGDGADSTPEPNCVQVELQGSPWTASRAEDVVKARLFAIQIIEKMQAVGFDLLASININTGMEWMKRVNIIGDFMDNANQSTDTWFFAGRV